MSWSENIWIGILKQWIYQNTIRSFQSDVTYRVMPKNQTERQHRCFLFFWPHWGMHEGSCFPDQRSNPGSEVWSPLIPGPPGNSQHTDWEKICAHHVSDKELIFQYISSHTSSAKKQSNLIKKWTEDQNRHFPKDDIQMAKSYSWSITRELQIKHTMTYHLTLISMAIIRKTRTKYLVTMQRKRNHCAMLVGM